MLYEPKDIPPSCRRAQIYQDYKVALELLHLKVTGYYGEEFKKNPFKKKDEPTRYKIYNKILRQGAATCYNEHCPDETILDSFIHDDLENSENLEKTNHTLARHPKPEEQTELRYKLKVMSEISNIQHTKGQLERDSHALSFVAPLIARYDFSQRSIETQNIKSMAVSVDMNLSSFGKFNGFKQPEKNKTLSDLVVKTSPAGNPLQNSEDMLRMFVEKVTRSPSSPDGPAGP